MRIVPKVTVICAWYNRYNYLDQTINSLLEQKIDNYKILIINDGSEDERVKKKLDEYSSEKIEVIHQKNIGFTKTLNLVLKNIDSKYVAIMGAGDISHENRLSVQSLYLDEHSDVSAVGTSHRLISENGNIYNGNVKAVKKLKKEDLHKKVPFTHGSVMYRTSHLKKAGGYDDFFECCQDWDLYFRLIDFGKIHSVLVDLPLYTKVVFFDGVSFEPEKKLKQSFYKNLAKKGDAALVDFYKNRPDILRKDLYSGKRRIEFSIKMCLRTLKSGDVVFFKKWFGFLLKSIFEKVRLF